MQASCELQKDFSVTYDLCDLPVGLEHKFSAMVSVSVRTQQSNSTAPTHFQRLPGVHGPAAGVEFDEQPKSADPTVWTISFTAAGAGHGVSLSNANFSVNRPRLPAY